MASKLPRESDARSRYRSKTIENGPIGRPSRDGDEVGFTMTYGFLPVAGVLVAIAAVIAFIVGTNRARRRRAARQHELRSMITSRHGTK